jgi:glutamate decarboxylase
MKRIWQEKRKAAGKSIHEPGPNIVMGANAQVALEKFARYFDVETRLVPVSVESKYRLDPKKAMEYIDENTIGIYVILGSMNNPSSRFILSLTSTCHPGTYTGHYEPVKEMAVLLDKYEEETGHSVPIHGTRVVTRNGLILISRDCSGWRIWGLFRSFCLTET